MLKKYNLLIAEDDEISLNELKEYFQNYFACVFSAKNGQIALDKFKQHDIDMAILDVNMPEINGLELAKKIKTINNKTLIAVCSAHIETNTLLKATELGLCKYIIKPLTREKVNDLLEIFRQKITELYPLKITLTNKEKQILKLLVNGLHNKNIAFELNNSETTIATHIKNIYKNSTPTTAPKLYKRPYLKT